MGSLQATQCRGYRTICCCEFWQFGNTVIGPMKKRLLMQVRPPSFVWYGTSMTLTDLSWINVQRLYSVMLCSSQCLLAISALRCQSTSAMGNTLQGYLGLDTNMSKHSLTLLFVTLGVNMQALRFHFDPAHHLHIVYTCRLVWCNHTVISSNFPTTNFIHACFTHLFVLSTLMACHFAMDTNAASRLKWEAERRGKIMSAACPNKRSKKCWPALQQWVRLSHAMGT